MNYIEMYSRRFYCDVYILLYQNWISEFVNVIYQLVYHTTSYYDLYQKLLLVERIETREKRPQRIRFFSLAVYNNRIYGFRW